MHALSAKEGDISYQGNSRIVSARIFLFFLIPLVFSSCSHSSSYSPDLLASLPETVDYNFHIRPILADRCFSCHGPDAAARKGKLRLDEAKSAYGKGESGKKAIYRGKLSKSEVWQRIHSTDAELVMPPPESKLTLSDREKALIERWIEQGAEYKPHWAFIPVEKPALPEVENEKAVINPIDRFTLAKLEDHNLGFQPQADKERLLRRLFFDLTGLPPDLETIDVFLADDRPDAYERTVDSLLNTKAYAERMTNTWLDLARYADSHGLHSDGWRSMYPWRDWVISAFDQNMPYDQFLRWQLAGDLFPNPSREQLIATGFNRNHKTTAEGGIIDEEYRAEYVHDRVATTATVFMGLTMECARCHDHKYDPISQEDYYRFYAFFNQVDELGLTGDDGNAGPNLLLPSPATDSLLDQIDKKIANKAQELEAAENKIAEQIDFVKQLEQPAFSLQHQRDLFLPFDQLTNGRADGNAQSNLSGDLQLIDSERGPALEFNGEYEYLNIRDQGLFDQHQAFAASIWIKSTGRSTSQTIMGNSGPKGMFWRGWDLVLDSLNRLSLRLINALPHDAIAVYSLDSVPVGEWTQVGFSYDGSADTSGIKLYINGTPRPIRARYWELYRSIYPIAFSKEKRDLPLRLGKSYRAFTGEYGIFTGLMDDFYLFSRELSDSEMLELAEKNTLAAQLESYVKNATPTQRQALQRRWAVNHTHPLEEEIRDLRKQRFEIRDTLPEVMIMKELRRPRETFVLDRGNYDQATKKVDPGTPTAILPYPASLPQNRVGLADWLLQPDHPLTSRVAVNRLWQHFFGQGLVTTSHDLGTQGSLPTHPDLLDWMAYTFMDNEWDIKKMIKLIVCSATYRQSSQVSPEIRALDPENQLYSRGSSYRLPAEMIRDQALAAAGLLNRKVGGPSVKPVQPDGLWKEKTSSTYLLRHYEPDTGSARYRRSMYTFVRRTSPHPAMTVFDAPNRSYCVARRSHTNTPAQALVLLNDPEFVEASRYLAQNLLNVELEEAIMSAFRSLTGCKPAPDQVEELRQLYQEERTKFAEAPEQAAAYLAIGQYPPDESFAPDQLAAMTLVVNTIMNFDESYTKR